MIRRSKFSLALLILSVLATSLIIHSAHAATTSQNITITPSLTAFEIDPGATVKASFDAINEGDTPFSVQVSSSPYYVKGVQYDPEFTQLPGTVNASKWVTFIEDTTQTLSARKLDNFDYTISVPAGTPAGGYYAVIFAETSPLSSDSNGVVSHNRVGDILYITVRGTIKTGGAVTGASIPHIVINNSVPLSVFVSNTGGTHFVTNTEIGVTSLFGKTVFHFESERYVLPQTKREISTTWTSTAPIGIYKINRTSTVGSVVKTLPVVWVFVIQRWLLAVIIAIVIIAIFIVTLRKRKQP
jgi:hypothetical protein